MKSAMNIGKKEKWKSAMMIALICFLPHVKVVGQEWQVIYPDNSNISGDLVKVAVLEDNRLYLIGNDIYEYDSLGYQILGKAGAP